MLIENVATGRRLVLRDEASLLKASPYSLISMVLMLHCLFKIPSQELPTQYITTSLPHTNGGLGGYVSNTQVLIV